MTQQNSNGPAIEKIADKKEATPAAAVEKTISDSVLARVDQFQKAKAINLPENYSAANALKFAYLMISEAKDKSGNPVLSTCSQPSVANALLEMVIQGLNPMKKQCYFVAMGNKLTMMRSYNGAIAVAKRVAGIQSIKGNVIYEGDVFEYVINNDGSKTLVKHEQDFKKIDDSKIIAAYAIAVDKDGNTELEVMNNQQIMKSWKMGVAGGSSKAHTEFKGEMSMKTVESRLCKRIINTSDDAALFTEEKEFTESETQNAVAVEIKEEANIESLSFDEVKKEEAQVAPEEQKPEEKKEETPMSNESAPVAKGERVKAPF